MEKFNISVLFVDDEKILRTVYKRVIGDWVDVVYLAENGVEGLELYQKYHPDLVITDIKMPIMNGLDMTLKIRAINPKARVIVLSAFSEANYMIRAIEVGIKNFLLKPVDNTKLHSAIHEQAREIDFEYKLLDEERKRISAERELKHNEQILQAVSETAEQLLTYGFDQQSIRFSLHCLGNAAQVSRVYIFENYKENGESFSRQTNEWVANDIEAQLDNTILLAVPHSDSSFIRWASELSQHNSVYGLIKDFPIDERNLLEPQNIVSVIAIPIFVRNEWYGFIGFDDCFQERIWSASEISTLTTAANLLGAAIYRTKIEKQLHQLNNELEERVQQRTQKLQEEIQERKMAELLLRQSEEKYRTIFENANDAIFLSIDAQIHLINPRFFELTGYYPNQLIGKSFLDLVHPDFRDMVVNNYKNRMLQESTMQSYDIQILTSKNETKWVEIKSSQLIWEGNPGLLSFLTDIQDRKTFESELRLLNVNLEARVVEELKHREKQQELFLHKSKLESLGELSAGMAHEINQPLGGLSMSLENILDDLSADQLSTNYLKTKISLMFSDIERIQKIIDHVRIFSRDQQNEEQQPFSVSEVINGSLLLVNRLFINNQIDLKVSIRNNNQHVLGNPFRLEQVLLNVLSNSRHAVDQKKSQSAVNFIKVISLESYSLNDMHVIEIEDNGIGIPEHILGNIFDPFFTTKNANDGTGLGLSISYGIIRDMNGSIEVVSEQDVCTKVTIKLPILHN
ncbi:MAG: multi-sensor signal transduction histidine kinase [Bacteroidetes bacterium]|nr:MAG: multi-sensor signal transduction histidine kinase [Bacteroidota bacterium]